MILQEDADTVRILLAIVVLKNSFLSPLSLTLSPQGARGSNRKKLLRTAISNCAAMTAENADQLSIHKSLLQK
jgi:hypothetical protein